MLDFIEKVRKLQDQERKFKIIGQEVQDLGKSHIEYFKRALVLYLEAQRKIHEKYEVYKTIYQWEFPCNEIQEWKAYPGEEYPNLEFILKVSMIDRDGEEFSSTIVLPIEEYKLEGYVLDWSKGYEEKIRLEVEKKKSREQYDRRAKYERLKTEFGEE